MSAEVLTGPSAESLLKDRRGSAFRMLLVLGWGGLFAYCAVYLNEDMPFRTPSSRVLGEPFIDAPEEVSHRAMQVAAPESPTAALVMADAAAPASPLPLALPSEPTATIRPASTGFDYVGTWGPTAEACGAPARRQGFIQATITPGRAKAGDTTCSFREAHRTGNAWTMAADCGDRDRRWSSQVRLVVDGDRLTWKSAWGTSAYVRCNRRTG